MHKANGRQIVVRQLFRAAALVMELGRYVCAELLPGYHIGTSPAVDARITSVQRLLIANGKTAFLR
jgi:hypothetical protein